MTKADRGRSRNFDELLAGYGIDDVASTVFRDQFGCWGFLDLWRTDGSFTATECDLLSGLAGLVTPALRRSLAPTFAIDPGGHVTHGGPVVLLLSDDLQTLTQTPLADEVLRQLLPTDADRAPVPSGAYNVAAQLLAREHDVDHHPPSARVHLRDGLWVTLAAARILDAAPGSPSIAVSIETTSPSARAALYARVIGLSNRETELLGHLMAGSDTRGIARRLFVSEHTVQDHLKSMFTKADVRSRRALIAHATGTG